MIATYRLQLWRDFTFADAAKIVDYLRGLGVSHLYLSPVMESGKGSNHGYDVSDFAKVSAERGGEDALLALDRAAAAAGLKLILDIVPNHMAADCNNPYWRDVLEKGRESRYWKFFDLFTGEDGKIRLPVLGDSLEQLVKGGAITVNRDGDVASLRYGDHCFPLKGEGSDVAQLLGAQNYTLVHWTETTQAMSYRRFFAVSTLVGLRVEDDEVYRETHQKLFALKNQLTALDGVRVDHIDGLAQPREYLKKLAQEFTNVWVEKIVDAEEELPDWPVRGMTGYEFIARLNGLMTDPAGFAALEKNWSASVAAPWQDFAAGLQECKEEVLDELFPAELKRCAELLAETPDDIPAAVYFIYGLTVCLPVYRSYDFENPADHEYINEAVEAARTAYGEKWDEVAQKYLHLLLTAPTEKARNARGAWQQLSGPAMAKGLEDRAHYRYTPLAALNEVGCRPAIPPQLTEPAVFAGWAERRAAQYPLTLNASSTHDTKRSEDTRARLYALADMPEDWARFVAQADAIGAPLLDDAATRQFFYQSVIGTWPLAGAVDDVYRARLAGYMEKSSRESGLRTTYDKPDKGFDAALKFLVESMLGNSDFVAICESFAATLSPAGAVNALTSLALKILLGGVPDIYQGNEAWDFSLVDPDNRRAVDFAQLQKLAAGETPLSDLRATWRSGGIKLALTRLLLKLRSDAPYMAEHLTITPLSTTGKHADAVLAFRIAGGGESLLVALPRYNGRFGWTEHLRPADGAWGDTAIDWSTTEKAEDMILGLSRNLHDYKTAAKIFAEFPLAVLKIS